MTPYAFLKYDVREWPEGQAAAVLRACSRMLDEAGLSYASVEVRWVSPTARDGILGAWVEAPSSSDKVLDVLSEDAMKKCCEKIVEEDRVAAEERAERIRYAIEVLAPIEEKINSMSLKEFIEAVNSDTKTWLPLLAIRGRAREVATS